MPSTIDQLCKRQLISPPPWLRTSVHYETMMGSIAYGTSGSASDVDVYGFCIPQKDVIFPHLAGHIHGFGKKPQEFWQYQQHHVEDKSSKKEYDLTIFNIVKYFQLCMENNPNCIDSLFTPQFCVLHITRIGDMMRSNRRLFLHRGSFHKHRGYAFSQMHKMKTKNPEPGSKRAELVEKYGFDTKFGSHVVRLLSQVEQILLEGDLDLQRNKEHLKAIRRGEVPEEDIYKWAGDKEKQLEEAYHKSTLPYGPPEAKIRQLLLDCLEEHYGDISSCVVNTDAALKALREVAVIVEKNRGIIYDVEGK